MNSYFLTKANFLSTGLKYQDTKSKTSNSADGNNSLIECPVAICENIAPVRRKKKPA